MLMLPSTYVIIEVHDLPDGPPDEDDSRRIDGARQEEVDPSPDLGRNRLICRHSSRNQRPGVNVIKLFTAVRYDFSK